MSSPQAKESLLTTLGIEVLEASKDRVVARMAVGPRLLQPFGLLHGGASLALAETVVSIGAWHNVDRDREFPVGLEINANHVRAVREGTVTATATPLHVGRRTQVWEARLVNDEGKLVCVSRCTLGTMPREGK